MTDLEQIEEGIKQNKKRVKLLASLEALKKNKDFKSLITDMYLKDYVLGLVTFKASISASEEKVAKHNDMQIAGVGALQQFFGLVRTQGALAKEDISEANKEREIILAEESEV